MASSFPLHFNSLSKQTSSVCGWSPMRLPLIWFPCFPVSFVLLWVVSADFVASAVRFHPRSSWNCSLFFVLHLSYEGICVSADKSAPEHAFAPLITTQQRQVAFIPKRNIIFIRDRTTQADQSFPHSGCLPQPIRTGHYQLWPRGGARGLDAQYNYNHLNHELLQNSTKLHSQIKMSIKMKTRLSV